MIHYRVTVEHRCTWLSRAWLALAAFLMVLPCGSAGANELTAPRDASEIEARIDAIWKQVDRMEAARGDNWLTRRRADDIREIAMDVIADADTRTSLQGGPGIVGYEDGYYFRTSDDDFLLRFRGQLQLRWVFDHRNKMPGQPFGKQDMDKFELRRSKLHFFGHVFDPSLTYRLTLATNTRSLANSPESTVFVENAFIQKRFENGMFFRLGQYKGPFLREELVPSSFQLAVERSMVNHAFTYGWTQGLEFGWDLDPLHLRAMYNDGPRQLNVGAYQAAMGSLLARAELVLAGTYADFETLTTRGTTGFGLMIGAAFEWYRVQNDDVEWAFANVDGQRSLGFTADVSMFGDGWTAFSYFVWANGTNSLPGFDLDSLDSWGWVGQAGLDILEDVQLFGRYELGDIGDYRGSLERPGQTGHLSTLTVGFNWWPIGIQEVKVSCDFGYSFSNIARGIGENQNPSNPMTNPGSAAWPGRGNGWLPDYGNQTGQWLIRAQLQFDF